VVRAEAYFPRGKTIYLEIVFAWASTHSAGFVYTINTSKCPDQVMAPFDKISLRDERDSLFFRPDHN
jgi:hypothetical protein